MIDYTAPTVGIVTDTNDPSQNGRVRVICMAWGDTTYDDTHEGEWAQYVSPFGGTVSSMTRGPGIDHAEGGATYGFWAIPKIGSQVIVMCLNGNPRHRIYMGCVFDPHSTNSLPHGRYTYDDSHPALDKNGNPSLPAGPFTNGEGFLEPLNTNMKAAFSNYGGENFEWKSRAADYTATAVDIENLNDSFSAVADDKLVEDNGRLITQGYQLSRIDPNSTANSNLPNYDSHVYCLTSPGFHAMSMDDRQENCRMRFRTTSGHQIILDDTNERIYIATAAGNNWIELDQCGNIDIFSNKKINVHSVEDINFTSDKSIKLFAGKDIHLCADKQIRAYSKEDMFFKTPKDIKIKSENMFFDINTDVNVKIGSNLNIGVPTINITATDMFQTLTTLNIKTEDTFITQTGDFNLSAANLYLKSTTGTIDINSTTTLQLHSSTSTKLSSVLKVDIFGTTTTTITGGGATAKWASGVMTYPSSPPAIISTPTDPTEAEDAIEPTVVVTNKAFQTNRIPTHEPWARVMTKQTIDEDTQELGDFSSEPELAYDDSMVGKIERGISIIRGMFWRR